MLRLVIFVSFFVSLCLTAVDLSFEEVSNGLKEGSLIYVDVRNRSELRNDGKIPGTFNIPGKTAFSQHVIPSSKKLFNST